ncbi:MAG: electron transfer flavoprotein subunit beta/FixA family protein [Candidatus Hermodarchaeota archaeon]
MVCVKQVPEVTEVKINPETGTLIREGVASILNPFCEYALDQAFSLKQNSEEDISITTLSMGPPQAKSALHRCLELGSDEAILLSDRNFAGADTWATALTLAEAIKTLERRNKEPFDLIMVGKHAIDGDTGQVGPEVAEILGRPQILYAVKMEYNKKRKRIRVKREAESGYDIIESKIPAIISVSKGEPIRRFPSLKSVMDARGKPLEVMTANDLEIPIEEIGLKGSPTQVRKIFPPRERTQGMMIDGINNPEKAVDKLLNFLEERGFLKMEEE